MKYTIRILPAFVLASSMMLAACASKPKADIASSANPQEEINRLDQDLKSAQQSDIDVLDFPNYDKAVKYLEEAKSDLAKRQKQEEVLDDVRYGRAALDAAKGTAEYRKGRAPTLFEARQAALRAGANRFPELQTEWTKTDREVIKDADDLSRLKVEKVTELQNQYVSLERKAVIQTQLGNAMAQINGAKTDRAEKLAGQTYKTARTDLAAAETVVSTNVRSEAGYKTAVDKANASARMLNDVMAAIKGAGGKLPEATAIQMVMQNRKITDLSNDLSQQKSETASAESAARTKEQELAMKNRQLSDAEAKVAIQAALERARKEFAKSDAEAYQQGNTLLIRLKTVAFSSGRADLPEKSLPILAKVSEVAKELGAAKIRVEGHTDSVGGEAKNQTLSEKRADAVATYLKTNGFDRADVTAEGYGLSKPLATNKSPAGRAQNRRVDIVITPGAAAKSGAQTSQE